MFIKRKNYQVLPPSDIENVKKSIGFTTFFMEMFIKHEKYQVLPPKRKAPPQTNARNQDPVLQDQKMLPEVRNRSLLLMFFSTNSIC